MPDVKRPPYPEKVDDTIGDYVKAKAIHDRAYAQQHLVESIDTVIRQLEGFRREVADGRVIYGDPLTNGGLYNIVRHTHEYMSSFDMESLGRELLNIADFNMRQQLKPVLLAFAKWVTNDLAERHPRLAKKAAANITFVGFPESE